MANIKNSWYVFYTRSNAEKAVFRELQKRHYETFLPMVNTLRRWKNRQKKFIYEVLFPGYILVRTTEPEISDIVYIHGIVHCVRIGDRPGVVPEKDVESIKRMLAAGNAIYTDHNFADGENVRVVRGSLAGCEGILIKRKGKNRFGILLKDINQCACINIHADMLERI
jgi:transcription antitermination factor NusG